MSQNAQITKGNTYTRDMNCHAGRGNCQRKLLFIICDELDELNLIKHFVSIDHFVSDDFF